MGFILTSQNRLKIICKKSGDFHSRKKVKVRMSVGIRAKIDSNIIFLIKVRGTAYTRCFLYIVNDDAQKAKSLAGNPYTFFCQVLVTCTKSGHLLFRRYNNYANDKKLCGLAYNKQYH